MKSWLIGKDPDAGKDWRQKEKGAAEDEMVRQHHWLNGRDFEQTPGNGGRQRSLVCCMQSMQSQRAGHNLATEQQQQKQDAAKHPAVSQEPPNWEVWPQMSVGRVGSPALTSSLGTFRELREHLSSLLLSGIEHPVSHVSGDNCCYSGNSFCLVSTMWHYLILYSTVSRDSYEWK